MSAAQFLEMLKSMVEERGGDVTVEGRNGPVKKNDRGLSAQLLKKAKTFTAPSVMYQRWCQFIDEQERVEAAVDGPLLPNEDDTNRAVRTYSLLVDKMRKLQNPADIWNLLNADAGISAEPSTIGKRRCRKFFVRYALSKLHHLLLQCYQR